MAITIREQVTGTAKDGNDVVLTFDAGANAPQEGDVIVVMGGHSDSDSTDDSGVANGPAGYTEIFYQRVDDGTNNYSFGCWYKVMSATPDTGVTCEGGNDSTQASGYASHTLAGVSASAPEDAAEQISGLLTTYDSPSITPVTGGAWVFSVVASNSADEPTGLTGYSSVWAVEVVDTERFSFGVGYKVIDPAAAEDPPAWADAGAPVGCVGVSMAIRPAGASSLVVARLFPKTLLAR